jgi:TMEM175 potassium channel family protein
MSSDQDSADAHQYLSTTRLEAFSDGVFAIAITLLVLDLALRPPGSPLEQVLQAWPSYLAYVVSFLTIGAAWLGHTELTSGLVRADHILLRINLLLLLVVVFLPFPTRLVAESLDGLHGERVYAAMYGLTLLALRVFLFALEEYGRREHLDSPEGETKARRAEHKLLTVIVGYLIAVIIGLVFPGLAVAAYFGIAVYLVVPFREITQLLFGRS